MAKSNRNTNTQQLTNVVTETQKKLALFFGKLELEGRFSGYKFTKDTPILIGKCTLNHKEHSVSIAKDLLDDWRKGAIRTGDWHDLSVR